MAAVAEVMQIERSKLIGLMVIYGWTSDLTNEKQWPLSKFVDKIPQFKDITNEEKKAKMTQEQAKLEIDILAHEEARGEFEVVDDPKLEKVEEKVEKPAVKAKAEKPVKTPKPEPEESPESESAESESETEAETEEKPITAKTKAKHAKEVKEKPVKTKVIVDKAVREPKYKYELAIAKKPDDNRPVVYNDITQELRKKSTGNPWTVAEAKKLIGWTEVADDDPRALFKDHFGKKIWLANRSSQRPFKMPLAERYESEHLREKWKLNLEPIVADKFGDLQQGQHRSVGFILAEQTRSLDPDKWGTEELVYETSLGFGIEADHETSDTFDNHSKRSLGDVMYRRQDFWNAPDAVQKKIARILAGAIRLVWIRAGGKLNNFASWFPHSEATEFYGKHPGILEAVVKIMKLDEQGNISALLTVPNVAGLLYLMQQTEHADKAEYFWQLFASGVGLEENDPILTLRNILTEQIATGSGGQREGTIYLVVKAWNAWVKDEKLTKKELKLKRTRVEAPNGMTKFILAEFPCMGGIDVEKEVEAPKKPEKAKAA